MKLDFLTLSDSYSNKNTPFFGIEYEIEAIESYNPSLKEIFKIVSDGSLRNYGKEFISIPRDYYKTLEEFIILHENISYIPEFDPYSERTSIHVHVNCQNLTKEQITNLIRLYIITEPLWFNYVSEERKNSIYCVPIYNTILQSHCNIGLNRLLNIWHKYTAFNIIPLKKFGTIEFRHLEGTNDYERFKAWLTSIKQLVDFIYNQPRFQVVDNLDIDFYIDWSLCHLNTILSTNITKSEIKELISPTLLDIKLSLI